MYDFARLRQDITCGSVLLPGDEGYEEKLQRWSEACVKRAAAVVMPCNSSEVSLAVKFAVSNQIPMTVCGGGHSSSGASSSEGMVIDKLPELLCFANKSYERPNSEGHCLALGIGFGPDGKTRAVSVIPLFHGQEPEARSYFSGLLQLDSIADNTEMMTTAKTNTLLNPVMDHGVRRITGSGNVVMPLEIEPMLRTAQEFWEFCERYGGMGKSIMAIEFFPTEKIREVAQDATAYANRGDYFDVLTIFGWETPDHDSAVREFNRSICKQVREASGYLAGSGGHWSKGPVGVYINVEAESISPEDAWGGNLTRLRELKKRYDPQNLFNKLHSIAEDTT